MIFGTTVSVRSAKAEHRTFLNSPEFRVVAEVADGLEAVQVVHELTPDLILLDIGLPNLNGVEAANRIRQFNPDAKIIFLTQESDSDVIREALNTGAQGYILKANAWGELFTEIEEVFSVEEPNGETL